ncbi:MMPL family transporter [Streptomyces sp. NRRL S-1521]|uniref:MMPL family transporter n=1 Tax=Streptomyces sp. NRRL S-1521 TaxID=1609100 RepID=UPI003B63FD04
MITSAGPVLAGTVAALGTPPLVAFAALGLAAALGVLSDTFAVRPVRGTALFLDVGPTVWWPHALAPATGPGPGRGRAAGAGLAGSGRSAGAGRGEVRRCAGSAPGTSRPCRADAATAGRRGRRRGRGRSP